jgi:hypothetical protein
LNSNKINDKGCAEFFDCLKKNHTLKRLELQKNMMKDQSMLELGKSLKHNRGLEFLDLSKNKEITETDGIMYLA